MYRMPGFIGDEPNGSTGKYHPAIRKLPYLLSYSASDRQHMKKCIFNLLNSLGAMWLLESVWRAVTHTKATTTCELKEPSAGAASLRKRPLALSDHPVKEAHGTHNVSYGTPAVIPRGIARCEQHHGAHGYPAATPGWG